jgi:hypothetical protein
MSWFKALRGSLAAASLLFAAATLGGCSFAPVYGGTSAARAEQLALAFARPNNRLEQIIYQELGESFGSSGAPDSRAASLVVGTQYADAALSQTANPFKPIEVTVTATLTIAAASGGQPVVITRAATASYTRDDQVLADRAAMTEATERAARSTAESLRLGILASLVR